MSIFSNSVRTIVLAMFYLFLFFIYSCTVPEDLRQAVQIILNFFFHRQNRHYENVTKAGYETQPFIYTGVYIIIYNYIYILYVYTGIYIYIYISHVHVCI